MRVVWYTEKSIISGLALQYLKPPSENFKSQKLIFLDVSQNGTHQSDSKF